MKYSKSRVRLLIKIGNLLNVTRIGIIETLRGREVVFCVVDVFCPPCSADVMADGFLDIDDGAVDVAAIYLE